MCISPVAVAFDCHQRTGGSKGVCVTRWIIIPGQRVKNSQRSYYIRFRACVVIGRWRLIHNTRYRHHCVCMLRAALSMSCGCFQSGEMRFSICAAIIKFVGIAVLFRVYLWRGILFHLYGKMLFLRAFNSLRSFLRRSSIAVLSGIFFKALVSQPGFIIVTILLKKINK